MPSRRSMRVAQLIRQEVSVALSARLSDPRLDGAAVTEVEMSSDLRRAYVYFACPRGKQDEVLAGFEAASGFIKRLMAPRMELKFTPDLVFRHDASTDAGEDMDRLLAALNAGDSTE